ncbi:hypothetical protein Lal_00019510 [Lupinus albus]|nr:hypothetical protein Lal_00019510 [Lupinus albus]
MQMINHTCQELEIRQYIGAIILLCNVVHALHLLEVLSTCLHSRVSDSTQRDRWRRELMSSLVHGRWCRDVIHMGSQAFLCLYQKLRGTGIVKDTIRSTVEEQVAKFLQIVGQNAKNSGISFLYNRSREAVSRHFHNVMHAIISLEGEFLVQPMGRDVPPQILNKSIFYPFFKMLKMKGQTIGSNHMRWTNEMDPVLMNAFTEELTKGNRHDGSWTSEAYSNVIKVLQHVVAPNMTKQHVTNRMKTLKEHFAESYDLFNNLSGFAWNRMTKRFEAEDDVWEDFIKDKPQAVKWRTVQIRHYDTLKELFGADRVTGKRALTARQRAPQMQHDNINLNDAQDDISMLEQVVDELGEGHFSPLNLESFSPAFAQSHQTIETSGSRGTKRKAQMIELVEGQLEKMSSGLGLVVNALNKGNCISDKLHDVADRQVAIADRHVVIAERQVKAIEKRNEIFQN